jgi:hypothetical protein
MKAVHHNAGGFGEDDAAQATAESGDTKDRSGAITDSSTRNKLRAVRC